MDKQPQWTYGVQSNVEVSWLTPPITSKYEEGSRLKTKTLKGAHLGNGFKVTIIMNQKQIVF